MTPPDAVHRRLGLAALRALLGLGALASLSTAQRLDSDHSVGSSRPPPISYTAVPDWPTLSDGRLTIGRMHGDIAVSSAGEVYVSVEDSLGGLEVYAPGGRFLRRVPDAPTDLHGFVIRREPDGEFIYAVSMVGQRILKMTLDGHVALTIPSSAIPEALRIKNPPNLIYFVPAGDPRLGNGEVTTLLTGIGVAPNGDIYVSDGYSSDYVHQFDRAGRYVRSFGGLRDPHGFKQLHKLAIDTRFQPARILACDRNNRRLIHLALDGSFIGVVATDLLRPSAVAIWGQFAAVAEAEGRVTVLDISGAAVARVGANTDTGVGTNQVPPDRWRPGRLNTPHGIAVNEHGDLFVSEFSVFGRVHRFDRQ
jgi:hypothetical protein